MVDKEQAERLLRLGMELIQTGAALIALIQWVKRKDRPGREKPPKPPKPDRKKR
jgi:hypothetical protein